MKRQQGLLIIGGASRNVGKTTLICKIIGEFSKSKSIIALKIKTITEGDTYFHGKDSKIKFDNYLLTENNISDLDSDSGRMIAAGARKSFLLRVKSEYLNEAMEYFLSKIGNNDLIICESNSLRKYYKPDLYLLIKNKNGGDMKPSALELENLADKIIYTNGDKHFFNIDEIRIEQNVWMLKN